ncbi:MAG: hypothetical protein P8L83_05665 [Flavobacteriaceae bacterium]|nr:hypothetical protein [Flavobacteriaceae bacterium]
MKSILKSIGMFLVILGIVLSLFDFLIDNKELIFVLGIVSIGVSYLMKN